jgi:biopolymer transport protein ExbD
MNIHVLIDAAARDLIRRAARNAPPALHERLREEWLAHLSDRPPGFSKLGFALGFIDVMLVLLVTLIIALPLMTHAVKLDLPVSNPPMHGLQPEVVDLSIDFDGTVTWNGSPVQDAQQLESYFRAAARKVPQPELHLRPDRRAKYDTVAKVLASARRNRMTRIGFVNTVEFGADPR